MTLHSFYRSEEVSDAVSVHGAPAPATDIGNPQSVEFSSNVALSPVNSALTPPGGSLQIDLKTEGVKHFLGGGMTLKGGHLVFGVGGLSLGGVLEAESLTVKGTLIVQKGAKVTASVVCDRLINFGTIDSTKEVVVHGLLVGWEGEIKAKTGIYARAMQLTKNCKLLGEFKDIDTAPINTQDGSEG